ncbi:contact-dependent growth inhibition system immunity protein [Nocardioides sp. P5_C9_2]
MNQTSYPSLWQFLGAYLHQDWRDDYADTQAALLDFMEGEPALAPDLASEIDRLLASTPTSRETEAAILDLGSSFVPSANGQDPREWLSLIRIEASRMLQHG